MKMYILFMPSLDKSYEVNIFSYFSMKTSCAYLLEVHQEGTPNEYPPFFFFFYEKITKTFWLEKVP